MLVHPKIVQNFCQRNFFCQRRGCWWAGFHSVWDWAAFLRLLLHFIMQKKWLLLILIGDTVGEKLPKEQSKVGGKPGFGTELAESTFADRCFQVLELISRKFDSAAASITLIRLQNLPHVTTDTTQIPQRYHMDTSCYHGYLTLTRILHPPYT